MNKKTYNSSIIQIYDDNAEAFAEKFDATGVRETDIRQVFQIVDKRNPTFLDIGCGNGRDAQSIVKYTDNYLGIDASPKLIALARKKVPNVRFEVAHIEQYHFPDNLDVVWAAASLLHVSIKTLKDVVIRSYQALSSGGVMFLSLKEGEYEENGTFINDSFGGRIFYLYSQEQIEEITAQVGFNVVKVNVTSKRTPRLSSWMEFFLQK